MAEETLRADKLVVQYGGVKAVDGVSLLLASGSIHGLIGPNGAGKSTVIDAISGRRRPTSGRVFLHDKDITTTRIIERRQLGLSRSFQRTSIFPEMRVQDQVELAAFKLQRTNSDANADEVLRELELSQLAKLRAGELGYGEQRRLDLALALVGRPTVLLLDEPMAGLSVPESQALAQHLKALTSQWDVSVLLVEHDMEVVFGISDTVTVLELGNVLAHGTPQEVRHHPRVREAYLGSAA